MARSAVYAVGGWSHGASAVLRTAWTAPAGHRLPWKASEEERAIVCALRRATGFPLDDLTFVITHFLPHPNRDAIYRILKAEGLARLPAASRARQPDGTFRDDDLGFVHMDVKHLPKLRTTNGESRKLYQLPADPCVLPKALLIVKAAKEVSQPDN